MIKVAIIGLGYVGLSLAPILAEKYEIIGYDVNEEKIDEYKNGIDRTGEVGSNINKLGIKFTAKIDDINDADFVIVTVPTPTIEGMIDDSYIRTASKMIAPYLKENAIVIYESTVYPFFTRDVCVPLLEEYSNKKCGIDFSVGYSPERVNPSDRKNTIKNITKVVSGYNKDTLYRIEHFYGKVIDKVHPVSSLEIAEACKVLENSQRDVNIALINQFAMLFPDIGTKDVIDAMNTKWNALGFTSGLVGGHCIAEDPHYLIYKTRTRGNKFTLLEEARYVNDAVPKHLVYKIMELLNNQKKSLSGANIVIKGITFKENCPDVRNSKAVEIVKQLNNHGAKVSIIDPVADKKDLKNYYDLDLIEHLPSNYDVVIYAVAHQTFYEDILNPDIITIDVKSMFYDKKNKNYYAL